MNSNQETFFFLFGHLLYILLSKNVEDSRTALCQSGCGLELYEIYQGLTTYAGQYFMNCLNETNKEAKIYHKDNESFERLE